MKNRTYHIETFGCQMNIYDSAIVESLLQRTGFITAVSREQAGLFLINTCSVRKHAEQRVFALLSQYKKLKDDNPEMRIGLIGCIAQIQGAELLKMFPHLDFIAGPDDYRRIPEIVCNFESPKTALISCLSSEDYDDVKPYQSGPCAGVAVMRGCDNFCSYCVVPYARGRERSRPLVSLIDEFHRLSDSGVKEITLLGQNVNSYRDNDNDFAALLYAAAKVDGIERIRFMTSHPKDLKENIILAMAANRKIAPHLHLPLQSGSDKILHKMNRGYTAEKYLNLITMARKIIPDISITTDIIVGFPGESDADFQQTMDIVNSVRFDDTFTYRYSVRPGTKAAAFIDDVPEQLKIERLEEIISAVRRIGRENLEKLIGKTFTVLIENESRKDSDWWMGRTEHNRIAVIPKNSCFIGDFTNFTAGEISGFTIRAEIKEDLHAPAALHEA